MAPDRSAWPTLHRLHSFFLHQSSHTLVVVGRCLICAAATCGGGKRTLVACRRKCPAPARGTAAFLYCLLLWGRLPACFEAMGVFLSAIALAEAEWRSRQQHTVFRVFSGGGDCVPDGCWCKLFGADSSSVQLSRAEDDWHAQRR